MITNKFLESLNLTFKRPEPRFLGWVEAFKRNMVEDLVEKVILEIEIQMLLERFRQ